LIITLLTGHLKKRGFKEKDGFDRAKW